MMPIIDVSPLLYCLGVFNTVFRVHLNLQSLIMNSGLDVFHFKITVYLSVAVTDVRFAKFGSVA